MAMDPHIAALLQWAGPTVLAVFGVAICFALRSAYNSFLDILRKNEAEHGQFMNMLNELNAARKEADMHRASIVGRQEDAKIHARVQDDLLHKHGERISAVEAKLQVVSPAR